MEKLKPCPFCGQEVQIERTDAEGNFHPDEYFDNPWSGLMYNIKHEYDDVEGDCPIATHKDEFVGALGYESVEELTEIWNTRK